ncbi:MAG: HEPN domain-containing protein [Lachnospiraceae bacterium]|nr:HEPN domain-containing protein [Lachnospiraceae bacterium]
MEDEMKKALAQARFDRAKELIEESETLIINESYKSANNRAYYAIEKTINGLLALLEVSVKTHKGCIVQFNELFVKDGKTPFDREDFVAAINAERIRNVSDYDDFYIANKKESIEQVEFAKKLYKKAVEFYES